MVALNIDSVWEYYILHIRALYFGKMKKSALIFGAEDGVVCWSWALEGCLFQEWAWTLQGLVPAQRNFLVLVLFFYATDLMTALTWGVYTCTGSVLFQDSLMVIEAFKSGFEPPGDIDFEDFTQPMKRTISESSLSNSRGDGKSEPKFGSKSKGKLWPFIKKNKVLTCKLELGASMYVVNNFCLV